MDDEYDMVSDLIKDDQRLWGGNKNAEEMSYITPFIITLNTRNLQTILTKDRESIFFFSPDSSRDTLRVGEKMELFKTLHIGTM